MSKRLLLDVRLRPAIGSRFQPTGFPDIGAALFQRPLEGGGTEPAMLVESAQSMANRLEGTAWDDAADVPHAVFDGLPYIRIVGEDDGRYLTSSRTEAHRLASAFIKDAKVAGAPLKQVIGERLGLRDDTPVPLRQVAGAVFSLDPFCLIHGVFFADRDWPGQPKIARALTGFVEAYGVEPADSGGVKKDHVRHSLGEVVGGTAEGYGTVPFHRVEWTAQEIRAGFSLDVHQLHSYGLGDDATELLKAIALWEIRTLLEDGLRLRTACDLVPFHDGWAQGLPELPVLEKTIAEATVACGDRLGDGAPLEGRWKSEKKAKGDKKAKD